MNNLSVAFPEKSEAEKKKIAKQFYRNFTDTFFEAIKLISASEAFIKRHYTGDMELFYDLHRQGKKCQVHLGHNFNWELAGIAMPLYVPYLTILVYMPIKNKTLDGIFKKIRSRTGAVLIPASEMKASMAAYLDKQYLLGLVADQNPGDARNHFWGSFFGKPAPFVKGPETGARTKQAAVVFCQFTKSRRGYYKAHFELATSDPLSMPEGELTRRYIRYLEKVISENPHMWLWSHRRWKHAWQPGYDKLWIDNLPLPGSAQ